MKPEKLMWKNLRESVGRSWKADRHEDQFSSGIADVSFAAKAVQGWIELKVLKQWPSRPDTVVKIPHFTPKQRVWLWEKGEYGGHVFLLIKIQKEWLLFNHFHAQRVGVDRTIWGVRTIANKIWIGTPPGDEFIREITK